MVRMAEDNHQFLQPLASQNSGLYHRYDARESLAGLRHPSIRGVGNNKAVLILGVGNLRWQWQAHGRFSHHRRCGAPGETFRGNHRKKFAPFWGGWIFVSWRNGQYLALSRKGPVEALTGLGDQAIRMTGPHPAAGHERQYRDSHSLHHGLRIARYLDTMLSWTRARLIADAKRRLGL